MERENFKIQLRGRFANPHAVLQGTAKICTEIYNGRAVIVLLMK